MYRFEYGVVLYGFHSLFCSYFFCHNLRFDALVEADFKPLVQAVFPCYLFVFRRNRKRCSDVGYSVACEYVSTVFEICQCLI